MYQCISKIKEGFVDKNANMPNPFVNFALGSTQPHRSGSIGKIREILAVGCFELGASRCCAPASTHAQVFSAHPNIVFAHCTTSLIFYAAPEKVNWFEKGCFFRCDRISRTQNTIDAENSKLETFGKYWISLETVP